MFNVDAESECGGSAELELFICFLVEYREKIYRNNSTLGKTNKTPPSEFHSGIHCDFNIRHTGGFTH